MEKKKVLEFDKVYIEYPEELAKEFNDDRLVDKLAEIPVKQEEKVDTVLVESRTQRLTLDELQKKLEETQALHL